MRNTLPDFNRSYYDTRAFKGNIANQNNVKTWIDKIKPAFKETVLINCAGVTYNAFAHKADLDNLSRNK